MTCALMRSVYEMEAASQRLPSRMVNSIVPGTMGFTIGTMWVHSITIWVLPPRERRERILWVIIFTHVGAMYKMMLPPANSGSAPGPLLRPSVFNMAVLPICIGCAFSFLMSCCCTFVRNCFFRYGVEEGRLGNIPCRLPRFGTTLRRSGFGLGCDRWFRNRFMHGGRRLFFVAVSYTHLTLPTI